MGVNLWGESPPYVNPVNVKTLAKVLAEVKDGIGLKPFINEGYKA
jgi:hypothetical protein